MRVAAEEQVRPLARHVEPERGQMTYHDGDVGVRRLGQHALNVGHAGFPVFESEDAHRRPVRGPAPGPGRGLGRSETIQLNVTDGTESQFVLPGFPGRPMFPMFSPDGRSVIAVGGQPGSSTGSQLGMWMVSLEGWSADLLVAGMAIPLAWSQRGEIYFLRNPFERSGHTRIAMITPNGGQSQTLLDLPFSCGFTELSISRDGKQVICAVADVESDVYVVEALGLTPGL